MDEGSGEGDGRGVCVAGTALTLEEGADLPPGCDAALAGVLAQRHFQEEHWDAAGEEEDEVGEEEGSCQGGGRGLSWQPTPQPPSAAPRGPRQQLPPVCEQGRAESFQSMPHPA